MIAMSILFAKKSYICSYFFHFRRFSKPFRQKMKESSPLSLKSLSAFCRFLCLPSCFLHIQETYLHSDRIAAMVFYYIILRSRQNIHKMFLPPNHGIATFFAVVCLTVDCKHKTSIVPRRVQTSKKYKKNNRTHWTFVHQSCIIYKSRSKSRFAIPCNRQRYFSKKR